MLVIYDLVRVLLRNVILLVFRKFVLCEVVVARAVVQRRVQLGNCKCHGK